MRHTLFMAVAALGIGLMMVNGPADGDEGILEPQELLHRGRNELRPVAEQLRDLGLTDESEQEVTQCPGGGFQAAQNEEQQQPQDLGLADRPTVDALLKIVKQQSRPSDPLR